MKTIKNESAKLSDIDICVKTVYNIIADVNYCRKRKHEHVSYDVNN